MRYSLRIPIAMLAGALLGCGEQPGPAEPASAPRPSLRTDQNPEGSGAQVIRFDTQGIILADPDRDFSLTIGVSPSEAPECGGTGELTGATVQVVSTPAELEHILSLARQQTMTLYEDFVLNPCDLIGANAPDIVATGRGNAMFVILDRAASVLLGFHATGTVELTSGGRAHLLLVAKFHVDADGTLRVHVDKFEVKPIGG
jgi:hypothetical protein